MADLMWALICYKASLDKETNQVSLLDVLEELTLAGDPTSTIAEGEKIAIAQHMEFATLWKRTEFEKPEVGVAMKLEIIAPSGKTLVASAELPLRLDTARRYRGIIRMEGLPFEGFGFYQFRLLGKHGEENWQEVTSVPLELKRQQDDPVALTPPPKRSRPAARKKKTRT